VLLVTGDHGEGLGDHGLYFNHIGLWEEMLRVPLIVWAPTRLPAGVRHDVVSGLDVAPTLLALAGLAVPPIMEGRDLFASPLAPRPLVAEAVKGMQITFRDGPWKLVRTLEPSWVNDAYHPAAGQVELYDLAADPAERTNRVATNADVARVLGTRLDAWMAAHGIAPDGTGYARASAAPSPAVAEQLRALGYAE
jgi:arylsulfatase A-like enzyme